MGNPKIENAYKQAGSDRLSAPHFSEISELLNVCEMFNVQIHEALRLNDTYVSLAIAQNILKNGIDGKAQEILNKT